MKEPGERSSANQVPGASEFSPGYEMKEKEGRTGSLDTDKDRHRDDIRR
jgi:hypothetical protein